MNPYDIKQNNESYDVIYTLSELKNKTVIENVSKGMAKFYAMKLNEAFEKGKLHETKCRRQCYDTLR